MKRSHFLWTFGVVSAALLIFVLFKLKVFSPRPKPNPISVASQSRPIVDPLQKVDYGEPIPAPNCGPKCQWRDTKDKIITLVTGDGETVVRVMINDRYTGYYMVVDPARPNTPRTEFSELEQAKYWSEKNAATIIKNRLR